MTQTHKFPLEKFVRLCELGLAPPAVMADPPLAGLLYNHLPPKLMESSPCHSQPYHQTEGKRESQVSQGQARMGRKLAKTQSWAHTSRVDVIQGPLGRSERPPLVEKVEYAHSRPLTQDKIIREYSSQNPQFHLRGNQSNYNLELPEDQCTKDKKLFEKLPLLRQKESLNRHTKPSLSKGKELTALSKSAQGNSVHDLVIMTPA